MIMGYQKAWIALIMPPLVSLIIVIVEQVTGSKIDPVIQTSVISLLTALGVYQVPNKTG